MHPIISDSSEQIGKNSLFPMKSEDSPIKSDRVEEDNNTATVATINCCIATTTTVQKLNSNFLPEGRKVEVYEAAME